jgi:carboxylesterase type B
MRGAWARFAKDPWSPPLDEWKTVGSQDEDVMVFDTKWEMAKDTVGKCEAWRAYIEDTHL